MKKTVKIRSQVVVEKVTESTARGTYKGRRWLALRSRVAAGDHRKCKSEHETLDRWKIVCEERTTKNENIEISKMIRAKLKEQTCSPSSTVPPAQP